LKLNAPGVIKYNRKIMTSLENIEKGLKGTCAICGKRWDMARMREYPLVEHPTYGVVHEFCLYSF